ncbi:UNVERIFIED_CONTAM: hypothetical protein Slati_3951300 [Sesamum latifolium]|uniref:Uncharacterized protein n=1 Tax=Sesamum latifolium TaxID=2727402 RepID=A0AAW2TP32_9LAMI
MDIVDIQENSQSSEGEEEGTPIYNRFQSLETFNTEEVEEETENAIPSLTVPDSYTSTPNEDIDGLDTETQEPTNEVCTLTEDHQNRSQQQDLILQNLPQFINIKETGHWKEEVT